jgi:hypothetical protein
MLETYWKKSMKVKQSKEKMVGVMTEEHFNMG